MLAGMDDLDGAQPRCPEDDVVMREARGAWECPLCGHVQLHDEVEIPADFHGADIDAWRVRRDS